MSEFSPEGVAFITGASSGIGLGAARQLVIDGVRKIAIIDIAVERLSEAEASLTAIDSSTKVLKIVADCSKVDEVEAAVDQTVATFGRLDFCLNAAGIGGKPISIAQQTDENFDAVLNLNLKGVWYCERAQIRQMMKQEKRDLTTKLPFKTRGAIVNVGSIASHSPIPHHNSYTIAKHGVLGMTKVDAKDYGPEGIRVICLCPGWIQTAMTQGVTENPQALQRIAATPFGRFGLPEEVGYCVSYLLSDKASFVSGCSFFVDGAMSCR